VCVPTKERKGKIKMIRRERGNKQKHNNTSPGKIICRGGDGKSQLCGLVQSGCI
jgi:hypothetical protein